MSSANPDVDLGDGARPTDPAREVEDFQVLVAAPGTLARTLAHQLDPDRRPKLYSTELAVTDRRLVVLGVDNGPGLPPTEVLWEAPREALGSVVNEAALKKLEPKYDTPPPDHTWEAVRQDNGRVITQLVFRAQGKTFRHKQKDITKWVDQIDHPAGGGQGSAG